MEVRDTFAGLLSGCRSLFPAALIASEGWQRCWQQARLLPRSVIDSFFGFEFRLGVGAPHADLCVVVRPGSDLARHYVRVGTQAPSGSPEAALASRLRAQVAEPDSYIADSVAGVVLEYDLAGLAPRQPSGPPGVFLAPRPAAPGTRPDVNEHGPPARLLAELAAIVGWSGYADVLHPYERVLDALPECGYVFQAGALPARSPSAFRVLIKGIPEADLPTVLRRLRWPGPTAAVHEILHAMAGLIAYTALSIDVTVRGLGPRIGVELYRPQKWFQIDRTGWLPVIDLLVERGWCLPAKADGLRRWPGTERLLTDRGEVHLVRQGINHVKVVIDGTAPATVKAYAGMDLRPLPLTAEGRGT